MSRGLPPAAVGVIHSFSVLVMSATSIRTHDKIMNLNKALLAAAGGMALATSLQAALTGRWDFDKGDLTGTGGPLQYRDGVGGLTQSGTSFNTTTGFGIPNIGVAEAKVMKFPGGPDDTGYLVPAPATANGGGGSFVNNYTILMDVLFPEASNSKLRAMIDADQRGTNPDAEFFVAANNTMGAKAGGFGSIAPNTWYRIGIVSEVTNEEAGTIRFRLYSNGAQVGVFNAGAVRDLRFALAAGGFFELFSDDNGETAPGYINSLQVHNTSLTKGQLSALGGPAAAGLPETLPPVSAFVEKWMPSGTFASRSAKVGAILDLGDSTVADATISLSLDGAVLTSPTISRANGMVTVEKAPATPLSLGKHVISLSYTDSIGGQKTVTKEFSAVVFYEDFEGLDLVPAKDEASTAILLIEKGWANRPPAGWSIDNSQFPAVVITEENPDADGDGYADNDGRTEWAGWSFATKEFWVAADNQTRDQFNLAEGTVAIADPDEWDDAAHAVSLFNSFLKTPEISLDGVPANTAFLAFASSWRPEGFDDANTSKFPVGPNGEAINNQTAIITVSFDGGAPVQVFKYDSKDGSTTFKADAQNESVQVQLKNPAGAKKMVLSFEMRDGANDWWWAVDNIAVGAGASKPAIEQGPVALEVNEGQPASMTVTVSGAGLSYQWFKGQPGGRVAVSGATAATLNLVAANVSDAGYYSVNVTNSEGTTSSGVAKLSVNPKTEGRLVLLTEDFEKLVLGPNVDEAVAGEAVWTKTPPEGWSIDDTGVPGVGGNDGVTEWAGWSFAKREYWAQAGGQNRDKFVKGVGTVAIGDSDEWDDQGHDPGNMATYIKTKAISLDGVKANSVIVKYDSSWNPEEPQTANVTVSFDGGAPVEIKRYESAQNNANYHPIEYSETLSYRVNNPAGAKTMVITYGYFNTLNNWWFAFDNLQVLAEPAPVFFEDFEGLVLGPNREEGITTGSGGAQTAVWTKTTPAGWSIDDTGVPGVGTDQDGVTEWAGWSFAKREWWASTAGDQQRTQFLKGTGTVAIADSDEWDDIKPHAGGNMATFLKTKAIDITGKTANSLHLKFDSSWRDEDPQKASIMASYDGGAPVQVLRWESLAGPNFHDDKPNETVSIPLYNPEGAKSLVLTFGYFDTLNNWWWAIDNLEVSVGAVVPPASLLVNPSPQIPGLSGGAFTDVQVDSATKTISAKLPSSGDVGYITIRPGVTILSTKIEGGRLVVKYQ